MEVLLQNGSTVINLVAAVVAICFWLASVFHVSRQNKEDISQLKSDQQRLNIGFQELRVDVTKMSGRLDTEVAKLNGKLDLLLERLSRENLGGHS